MMRLKSDQILLLSDYRLHPGEIELGTSDPCTALNAGTRSVARDLGSLLRSYGGADLQPTTSTSIETESFQFSLFRLD